MNSESKRKYVQTSVTLDYMYETKIQNVNLNTRNRIQESFVKNFGTA